MQGMFDKAKLFNQPIGDWNTSKVTAMKLMFLGASSFNQPISDWNVSNVTNMNEMFNGVLHLDQPEIGMYLRLPLWNVCSDKRQYLISRLEIGMFLFQ